MNHQELSDWKAGIKADHDASQIEASAEQATGYSANEYFSIKLYYGSAPNKAQIDDLNEIYNSLSDQDRETVKAAELGAEL